MAAQDPPSAHLRGGYFVEYAKSSRAACKQCQGTISQDTVRIGKETKSNFHDGTVFFVISRPLPFLSKLGVGHFGADIGPFRVTFGVCLVFDWVFPP
jgi:hypothetical protein